MPDLPDNIDLRWLGQNLVELRGELHDFRRETREEIGALRADIDTLIRLVTRLWDSQGELRRRLEALESREP